MFGFLSDLPLMLLALPAILISLSVHEASHGYAAYKLGDNTAYNMGRLTLNPLKHINLFGFLSMLFFNVGWANPVPVNSRFFKNPRRDMAITAAAGPVSNLCLSIIFTVLLRLVLIPIQSVSEGSLTITGNYYYMDEALAENPVFTILSLLAIVLYLGISLNLNLMFFNLIPLPPLDGSRVLGLILPDRIYFKIMQYERYIYIGLMVLVFAGVLDTPIYFISDAIFNLLLTLTGLGG